MQHHALIPYTNSCPQDKILLCRTGRRTGALAVLLAARSGSRLEADEAAPLVDRVKTAFRAKPALFVKWPAAARVDEKETFTMGILDKDPFRTNFVATERAGLKLNAKLLQAGNIVEFGQSVEGRMI